MNNLRAPVYTSLFTALIVVGAYLKIPIGPVPIVLANFFVLLAGLVLGARWALASVGLYLLLGALGLPVFASGSGVAYMVGPTGGYLVGYLLAAFLTGLLSTRIKAMVWRDLLATSVGALSIYVTGVPWLKYAAGMNWAGAVAAGLVPFLIGDSIKVVAAGMVATLLRKTYPEIYLTPDAAG